MFDALDWYTVDKAVQALQAKANINAGSQRIDDIADFHISNVKLRTVAVNITIRPDTATIKFDRERVKLLPLLLVWMYGDVRWYYAQAIHESTPKLNCFQQCPMPKRKGAKHVEITKVCSIAHAFDVIQTNAALSITHRYSAARLIFELLFELLHSRRTKQGCFVIRQHAGVINVRQPVLGAVAPVLLLYAFSGVMASSIFVIVKLSTNANT